MTTAGLASTACWIVSCSSIDEQRGDITQTGNERTAAVHPSSSSFILVHPRLRAFTPVRARPCMSAYVRGRALLFELVGARVHACAHVGPGRLAFAWRRTAPRVAFGTTRDPMAQRRLSRTALCSGRSMGRRAKQCVRTRRAQAHRCRSRRHSSRERSSRARPAPTSPASSCANEVSIVLVSRSSRTAGARGAANCHADHVPLRISREEAS